ncbi:MAG: hypothetical protein HQ519_03375 [Planctomycetes bacterium]|nr:hypothetical protein [Planctomycetota bacterium]
MSKVLYVHWKHAEGRAEVAELQRLGHEVTVFFEPGGLKLADLKPTLPEVVVINMDRLPSHGRTTAHWLRSTKATQRLPIVFCGGAEKKVALARAMLGDAVFCQGKDLAEAVRIALTVPQMDRPITTCSSKPLWQKLGIMPGHVVFQLGGPISLIDLLGDDIPADVKLRRWVDETKMPATGANLILLFAQTKSYLRKAFPVVETASQSGRPMWVFWIKRTSPLVSNLSQSDLLGMM